MSSEILRQAAAMMRERASRAIRSPWHVDRRDDGRAWICETANDGRVEQTLAMHGFPSTAEHIASWHPAVALAVADWLDATAAENESTDALAFLNFVGADALAALTVARAYLGGDA